MGIARRFASSAVTWALCALAVAGCGKTSSQPTQPPPTERQVAATVEDTTGARIAGATVWAIQLNAGATAAVVKDADAAGVASFTLADGRWCLSTLASARQLVAASVGQVAAHPVGNVDTVVFRLVVRPAAVARGKVTLTGQAAHDGTIISAVEFPAFTNTAADGSFELDALPPGTWTGVAQHPGFQSRLFDIPVPAPGDTVTTGLTFALQPGGPAPRP